MLKAAPQEILVTSSILNSGSDNPFLSRRDCLNGFHTKSISSLVYPSEIKLHDYWENTGSMNIIRTQECIPVGCLPFPCSGRLSCHACPPPCMHPCHACSLPCYACPPAMHAPLPHTPTLPCMPPTLTHTWPLHYTYAALHHACPLWTDFLTHACENITFPQLLLRTVINTSLFK